MSRHSRSGTSSCAFCGRPWSEVSRSKEHVWPRWIRKHAGDFAPGHFNHSLGFGLDEEQKAFVEGPTATHIYKKSIFTTQTREICTLCNNGWMSTLEIQAEPLFVRLVEAANMNKDCLLTASDSRTLARWMQKTALTSELTMGPPYSMPCNLRRRLRDESQPLIPGYVWAGRLPSNAEMFAIQARLTIGNTRIPDPRDEDRFGMLSGIAFRKLLVMSYTPSSRRHEAPWMPLTAWTLLSPRTSELRVEFPPPNDLSIGDVQRLATDYRSWLPLSGVDTFVRNPNAPTVAHRN
jgi:hypothetical protein